MSDIENNKETTENQTNPSHYEQAREHAKQGFRNSAEKANELSQNPPESKAAAAMFAARTAAAGIKDYGKAAYHAGMGFMEEMSRQNPNAGQQLNNMKIDQAIAEGAQANQSDANKGIESFREKAASVSTEETVKSENEGIKSFQSKSGGESADSSKSEAAGTAYGSSEGNSMGGSGGASNDSGSGQSGGESSSGESSGGESSGNSQGR